MPISLSTNKSAPGRQPLFVKEDLQIACARFSVAVMAPGRSYGARPALTKNRNIRCGVSTNAERQTKSLGRMAPTATITMNAIATPSSARTLTEIASLQKGASIPVPPTQRESLPWQSPLAGAARTANDLSGLPATGLYQHREIGEPDRVWRRH